MASLDTCERSTSIPSLFISSTTCGRGGREGLGGGPGHLGSELADAVDSGGELATLHLHLQLTSLLLHCVTCAASAQGVLQPWVRVWAGRSVGEWEGW